MPCPVSPRAELGFCLHLSPLFNTNCCYTADETDAKLSHRSWPHSSARRSSTSGIPIHSCFTTKTCWVTTLIEKKVDTWVLSETKHSRDLSKLGSAYNSMQSHRLIQGCESLRGGEGSNANDRISTLQPRGFQSHVSCPRMTSNSSPPKTPIAAYRSPSPMSPSTGSESASLSSSISHPSP